MFTYGAMLSEGHFWDCVDNGQLHGHLRSCMDSLESHFWSYEDSWLPLELCRQSVGSHLEL